MVDKITHDMGIEREAKMAVIAGDLLDDILSELSKAVDRRMFSKITMGEKLSSEDSWMAWGEKAAYNKIKTRIEQKIKLGDAASERLAPHMKSIA